MISIRDVLKRIFTTYGLADEFHEQEPLFLWEEAVGEQIARLTAPLRVREGVIFVEVPSHVLAQELSMLKEGYIRKINELLGEERVRDIRFRIGAGGAPREREEEVRLEEVPLSAADQEEIEHLVSDVEDGRLREALRRFFITERRIERLREEQGFKRCPRCGVLHRGDEEICPYCQLELGQDNVLE
ncbi:MAG: DciA family protein [Candidatus Bipolaricaulia bacterium]